MKIAVITASLAGLIGLAACSSDNALTITKSNAAEPTTPTTPGHGTPPPVPGAPPPNVTAPDISEPSNPGITLPPGITLAPGDTLPDISDLTIPDIQGPDASSPTGSVDPAEVKDCDIFRLILGEVFAGQESGLGDIQAALDQLAKTIPAEYADDLETVGDVFITVHEVLDKNGYDYSALFTDPTALAALSQPGFSEALGKLEPYYANQCVVIPES